MTYIAGANGIFRAVDTTKLKSYSFEIGSLRPPSEVGNYSLLLRVTRNCPWNRCTFCYGRFYNREQFTARSVDELVTDIQSVHAIKDEIASLSLKLGYLGKIKPLSSVVRSRQLYEKEETNLNEDEFNNLYCVVTVLNWLISGGENVFLQDADTPVMDTDKLVEILMHLTKTFPSIKRITSFIRSKTIIERKTEELSRLRQAGIIRLYVGLETGDDELLTLINKGVTAKEHIRAGKKALKAGFEVSECIMPGLGGKSMWIQHATNTARVLNEINPHFIRLSPFVPIDNTPLLEAYQGGEFELTSPHERLQEIKLMIEELDVSSNVCFTHPFNTSYRSGGMFVPLMNQDYDGYKFPEEKALVLELIDKGLQLNEKAFLDIKDIAGINHL
ncbi:radical SAM protein [Chloroflexota bacterium]